MSTSTSPKTISDIITLALNSISRDTWDCVVLNLEQNGGVATLTLPEPLETIHAESFQIARKQTVCCRNNSSNNDLPTIPSDADSAHATGHHGVEGMSRYNAYREGFVFSDGRMMDSHNDPLFRPRMEELFESLHGIACHVLLAMERRWNLPKDWFQQTLGPTRDSSQWHVKRYVTDDERRQPSKDVGEIVVAAENNDKHDKEPNVLLPVHTDPSLISIVIHDCRGKQEGAMGLQYQSPNKGENNGRPWIEVPYSGHKVATVFVGSVLSYMTGGSIRSAKHRVVQSAATTKDSRMAATLFVRPKGTAVLQVPPCSRFESISLKKQVNFHTWSARVARNYSKGKALGNDVSKKKESSSMANNSTSQTTFRDDYTELSLLPCNPPLTGKEKYLGGEMGFNGKVYCVPGHARRVLVIDPSFEPPRVEHIGPEFPGEYKWLRAVRMSTGILYAIPCHADSILRIDPKSDTVSTLTWDQNDPLAPPVGMPWKWHGGNIAPSDGCLYCIPQYAEHVLKVDPVTEEVSFLGGPFPGRNKFYGGLVGKDGCIYGVPQNSTGVLRIDPAMQSAAIHGNFPEGRYKWHGGLVGPDGCIYGIPAHADSVLLIQPGNPPTIATIGGPLRTGAHRDDGKYKYLGGAVGHDNCIYFFPSDADYVLQVDPQTQQVRDVGPNLRDIEPIHQNKWQNGFTAADGSIYGIPLKSSGIIRIQTSAEGAQPEVSVIGDFGRLFNKWEGGVLTRSGDIFCMPLNFGSVLRIKPLGVDRSQHANLLET